MNAFEDKEASYSADVSFTREAETSGNMSKDFENMTYDNHFKNVFSITGKFQDLRLREHDYAFDDVVAMYGKELSEMSSYISEVAEERAEAREEGREEGRKEIEKRIVLNMCSKGYNAEIIAELCEVDLKTVNNIINKGLPE